MPRPPALTLRLEDVLVFDRYSADPSAANSVAFADVSQPVWLGRGADGEAVLTTTARRGAHLFGHLYVLHDAAGGPDRLVVVRR